MIMSYFSHLSKSGPERQAGPTEEIDPMAKPSRKPARSAGNGAQRGATDVAYPELFQPIEIGNCQIDNRIVMAPMNVLMSSGNTGLVNDQILAYYAARARGGTGLIITECVLGTRLASRFPYTSNLHLFNPTHLAGLEELTETVHAFGSKVFIQLSIGFGRQGHNPDHESPPAPSAIPYETNPEWLPKTVLKNAAKEFSWFLHPETPFASRSDMPREMTREEIQSEIAEYGNSCRLAVVAGFDGIEIHAPHGYLEHQFLSPRSNKRTDEYGGSLENRMRFLLECYDSARAAVGDAIPIGVRLSGAEHMPEGIQHDELKIVVKTLGERGIDYVHLSDGSYEALKYFFPEKDGTMLDPAESFKSVLPDGVPVVCVSIHDPAKSAAAIGAGRIDMVSLGRQMLADPDYANKVKAGEKYDKCARCNECLLRTARGLTVRCSTNPNLGRERFMPEYHRPPRARKKQRVLRSLPEIPVPGMENLRELAEAARKQGAVPEVAEAFRKAREAAS
jgi:2,4-dienoyl-CoA reductase-like NADH-dependent reductase (Old Yellow Enzyme family)